MMHIARSDPLFQARAPTKRILIRERRTRITTVNSMRVIPDFLVFWVCVSVMVSLSVLVDDAHECARVFEVSKITG